MFKFDQKSKDCDIKLSKVDLETLLFAFSKYLFERSNF